MKYLDGNYYVQVKNQRYEIQPTETVILRLRDTPTSLRTQYHGQKMKLRQEKSQKVSKNDNDE